MRQLLALAACLLAGCASRSQLDRAARLDPDAADAADATQASDDTALDTGAVDAEPPDLGFDTWSREAGRDDCFSRPLSCFSDHDFGPRLAIAEVYNQCSKETGPACGDLTMVFDGDGCLVEVAAIRDYSSAFIDCVVRMASTTRWECGQNRGLRMLESCAP
ncbi:MAG: hypothetical protein HYV09_23850 [Deltaproteobacteria bacterium]|nr:hypothetical protein [Deltaproteobacteria bacterium]